MLLLPLAHAATPCMSVDEFNDWMEGREGTYDLTLNFDATGVNPSDFWGTKGALADLADQNCADGASMALKVYGPDDPPNESHPAGTLKQEYGSSCLGGGETWADPNASEVIFTDGSEVCDVTIWTNPETFGYRLVCNVGTFEGEGDNTYDMPVNLISIFSLSDGSTWKMNNATTTYDEVCFEDDGWSGGEDTGGGGGGQAGTTMSVGVSEDVTVSASFPSSLYPDEADLSVEAGDSEAYVKFNLSDVPGAITRAILTVNAHTYASAEGDGADVYATAIGWSESSLTWSERPGPTGPLLDAIDGVTPGNGYTVDVSAAVGAPGIYAFVLTPSESDTNGAHFQSSESSVEGGPTLEITYTAGSGGDTGAGGGVGDDDGGDDAGGGGRGDEQGGDDTGARRHGARAVPDGGSGCGCAAGSTRSGWITLAIGAAALARRRR